MGPGGMERRPESPRQCLLENPGHTYPNPTTGQHHKYPLCQEPCGERPGVCELNPRSLWPGQDTGRPWKEGQGGRTGEGMGSRGAGEAWGCQGCWGTGWQSWDMRDLG